MENLTVRFSSFVRIEDSQVPKYAVALAAARLRGEFDSGLHSRLYDLREMGRMATIAFSKHCNSEMRQYSSLELRRSAMIPIRDLFEAHLTVANLQRSMSFFGAALGLELAQVFPERKVAFYWIGRRGDSMLGLWEAGTGPQRMNLHVAFSVDLDNLLQAAGRLREANIIPLDFGGEPTDEPVVFAWMPAASLFFHDPDGNLLEFLSMLPDAPQRDLGVVGWSRWKSAQANEPRR